MEVAIRGEPGHAAAGMRSAPGAEVTWAGAMATVTVTGELDRASMAVLARKIGRVAASHPQQLLLDLHGVTLVNLPGDVLMTTMRQAVADQCPLVLRASAHLASPHATPGQPGQAHRDWPQAHSCGPGDAFSVHLAWSQDHVVLALAGELDLVTAHHLQDAVHEISSRPAFAVHLELSRLRFADVAGVRGLYRAQRHLQQMGCWVTFTGMQPQVRRVADVLGDALAPCPLY